MKIKKVIVCFCLLIIVELVIGAYILQNHTYSQEQDVVAINDLVMTLQEKWPLTDFQSIKENTEYDFSILDNNEKLMYTSDTSIASTLNDAIEHYDTLLDITKDNHKVGTIIIHNPVYDVYQKQYYTLVTILISTCVIQILFLFGYSMYIHRSVLLPFSKLEQFASEVAKGNLDAPLQMDRQNIFGAFSESFDIMREELKLAKQREWEANQSKKELIAKLSHDIKTPVASIKAVCEVLEVTGSKENQSQIQIITTKADQINTLITDLFHATLEELKQLPLTVKEQTSLTLQEMLSLADYQHMANIDSIPECIILFDYIRLQQVFDNIFINSYKYANTKIKVSFEIVEQEFLIYIQDYGKGVIETELPFLTNKYYRGSNKEGKDGAGLGLYIASYFLQAMGGNLTCWNMDTGFMVELSLPLPSYN